MAQTLKNVVTWYNPATVVSFPVGATAVDVGDMVQLSSSLIIPLTAATDDSLMLGIALGKAAAGSGDYIPVATECLVDIGATSAAYAFGAGLKWASANSLVADGDANTIAWCYDFSSATRTRIKAYFNVRLLSGKLWDACNA